MKPKSPDLIDEIKNAFGKCFSGNEISNFVKKINGLAGASVEAGAENSESVLYSQAKLITDQLITYAEKKLPTLNFLELLRDVGKMLILRGELVLAADISASMISYTHKDIRLMIPAANAFLNFAEIYIYQAMWHEALASLKKATAFFYKENDPIGLARCESLLGTLFAEKGQLANAMTHFQKGFTYLDAEKDISIAALLENNIGIVYNIQGEYDKAYTYFRRALLHFEGAKDNKHIARVRHNLGMLFLKKKEYNSALKEFDTSIGVSLLGHYFPTLAISYVNKAAIYCTLNDDALAEAFANRGMEISSKINDKLTIADVYKIKGVIERKKKRFDLAQNYFFSSLRINKELENELNYAETAVELGIMFHEIQKPDEAKIYFDQALKYFKKIKAKDEIRRIKNYL